MSNAVAVPVAAQRNPTAIARSIQEVRVGNAGRVGVPQVERRTVRIVQADGRGVQGQRSRFRIRIDQPAVCANPSRRRPSGRRTDPALRARRGSKHPCPDRNRQYPDRTRDKNSVIRAQSDADPGVVLGSAEGNGPLYPPFEVSLATKTSFSPALTMCVNNPSKKAFPWKPPVIKTEPSEARAMLLARSVPVPPIELPKRNCPRRSTSRRTSGNRRRCPGYKSPYQDRSRPAPQNSPVV